MRKYFRIAATTGSVLALSALAGFAGLTASAQPPATETPVVQPGDATDDTNTTEDFLDTAPADQGADTGGGSTGGALVAPSATGAPTAPAAPTPDAASPDTAPLGSSGGGGTGGNGRPTQEPIKDG